MCARGTAAICFALLGDPWAGQRLLSELLGLFQGLPSEASLETVARNNHCAVCLLVARAARDAGDDAGCSEALDHAEASLGRAREIVRQTGDHRLVGACTPVARAAGRGLHSGRRARTRTDPAARVGCRLARGPRVGPAHSLRATTAGGTDGHRRAGAGAATSQSRARSSSSGFTTNCARNRAFCACAWSSNTSTATVRAPAAASHRGLAN